MNTTPTSHPTQIVLCDHCGTSRTVSVKWSMHAGRLLRCRTCVRKTLHHAAEAGALDWREHVNARQGPEQLLRDAARLEGLFERLGVRLRYEDDKHVAVTVRHEAVPGEWDEWFVRIDTGLTLEARVITLRRAWKWLADEKFDWGDWSAYSPKRPNSKIIVSEWFRRADPGERVEELVAIVVGGQGITAKEGGRR